MSPEMENKNIAVLVTHSSHEMLPALEAALTMRDEATEPTQIHLIALGEQTLAADCAREGLFRGADSAIVIHDPLFGGIDESALIELITKHIESKFDTVITSGQGNDCRPRNAHRVLRYKRAKTLRERTDSDPYNHLYDKHPHLTIPSWRADEIGITADEISSLRKEAGIDSSSRWGEKSHPTIIRPSEQGYEWVEEIAEILLANRPARLSRRLRDAQLVVGGGYGVGSTEGFESLAEFATEIKARMGATRAAVDAEFCPAKLMIGPTGERIHPKLYIACGISGQVQHIAGIAEGTRIISINPDPEAPITEIADIAIIATIEETIPRLIESYRRGLKTK
ncbi:MAG: FAD-binding protein [Tidjanibacter sp.]|nr:FAD-binding protein [Tidjanibacter sp.]